MFEFVNFVIKQLQRLKKALAQPELNDFAPDGKSAEDTGGHLTQIGSMKAGLIKCVVALGKSRGAVTRLAADGHAKAVKVYASMRSVYRRDADSLRAISGIPKPDQTPRQTLARMEHTAEVWAALPDMPGTPKPFTVGALTLVKFTGLAAELRTAIESCEGCDSTVDVGQGRLTALATEATNFVSAAVAQGRSNYDEGTPARAWVETIPLEPSTQAPGQAEISEATSPAAGAVHLAFDAPHATSFTLQHKAPGAAEFATVAEDVTADFYDVTGLAAGEHQFAVIGHNSRGDGPASEIAKVRVAVAAVA